MRIEIFGGSGFIGTRLCHRLALRNDVKFKIIDKVISHDFPSNSEISDIRYAINPRLISNSQVIINLAAEHREDVSPLNLYDEVNVGGARNICELAKSQGINKIIFTSSVAVYGFAPLDTNESGLIAPFNDYGRTKWEAEEVYKQWQAEDTQRRTLVIIRPTVVFGEGNRGNVFNLFRQITSGKFIMIGDGLNRKSVAYVENVAAFLEYSLAFKAGVHIYNYVDKPDFTMRALVQYVNKLLGGNGKIKFRLPFWIGLLIGSTFDLVSKITGKKFPISAIRIKKFCANSVYASGVESTDFSPPVSLMRAIEKTIYFEFIESNKSHQVFYSE